MSEIHKQPTREEVLSAIVARTGKTREQAEAGLNILGSAFARRGWAPGEPLSPEDIERNLNTFLGSSGEARP